MATLRPLTQAQFKVQISGAGLSAIYFTTFSGFKDQASTSQYADGQNARIKNLVGPRTLQPMTLSVPYDPSDAAQQQLISNWKYINCAEFTVVITPVRCTDTGTLAGDVTELVESQLIFNDSRLTSLSFMNVDRTSSNVSMLELGFISDDYKYATV